MISFVRRQWKTLHRLYYKEGKYNGSGISWALWSSSRIRRRNKREGK